MVVAQFEIWSLTYMHTQTNTQTQQPLCSLFSLRQERQASKLRTGRRQRNGTETTTAMCLSFHRKMVATTSLVVPVAVTVDVAVDVDVAVAVVVTNEITGMDTREHTDTTDDGENANTNTDTGTTTTTTTTVVVNNTTTALTPTITLTLLPTETETTATVAIESMDTVVKLCSYSPDTVMMAIAAVSESLPTMPARDMDALLAAGLCQALVQAMDQHGDVVELQGQACFLLVNLAFQSDDIAARIIHSGGDVAVVTGMKRFPLVAEFQLLACVTLNNLLVTTNEDGGRYESVVAAGGIRTLIAAMNNFPGDIKIGLFACFCLLKLTDSSLDNCRLAVEHGALDAVVGVISASQDANDGPVEGLAVVLLMRFLLQHEEKEHSPSPYPRATAHAANE